jgi:hypothetical protein
MDILKKIDKYLVEGEDAMEKRKESIKNRIKKLEDLRDRDYLPQRYIGQYNRVTRDIQKLKDQLKAIK